MAGSPGFPAQILLNHWGADLRRVFKSSAYVVGSCAKGKGWRDVDVVVMLEDEEFDRWFGPLGDRTGAPIWEAICLSFSLWGREVTGLPIDFKVQRRDEANKRHNGPRSFIGVVDLENTRLPKETTQVTTETPDLNLGGRGAQEVPNEPTDSEDR